MKRQILLICVAGLLSINLFGQDPIFSQFYSAPLQLNPAFSGNTYAPRIALNYRNQWPSLGSPFVTYAASYEQFFEPLNSGIGIMIQSDDAGDGIYATTNAALAYSYRLTISKGFFAKFGTEIGATQVNLDWDRIYFGDQIDRITGPGGQNGTPIIVSDEIRPDELSKTFLDIGAGFLFYNPHFYAGISAKHLNTPDEGFIRFNENLESGLPIRWSIHGGSQITLREGNRLQWPIFISPNATYIWQGDFGQIDAGAYVGFGMFFAGAWYRHALTNADAAIVSFGVQKDIFKIGYSLDLTVSELANQGTGGSHELSFIINFENGDQFKNNRKKSKYNDCFKLFR